MTSSVVIRISFLLLRFFRMMRDDVITCNADVIIAAVSLSRLFPSFTSSFLSLDDIITRHDGDADDDVITHHHCLGPRSYGIPFFVHVVPERVTGRQLYAMVHHLVKRFVSSNTPFKGKDPLMTSSWRIIMKKSVCASSFCHLDLLISLWWRHRDERRVISSLWCSDDVIVRHSQCKESETESVLSLFLPLYWWRHHES